VSNPDCSTRSTGGRKHRWGLVAGPLVAFVLLLLPPPEGLDPAGWRTAAVGILMALWWVTEALPLAATALLPLALFPVLEIRTVAETAGPYANPVIFLLFGGFVLAVGLESSGLHRRLALSVIRVVGTRPRRLVAGFMLATAFTSMWVSNTATTAMMLPMALSVLALVEAENGPRTNLTPALLIGIAYAANLGGMGTLVGTAPNALLAGFLDESTGFELTFLSWMAIGVPIVAVALPLVWLLLVRVLHPLPDAELPGSGEAISRQLAVLGRASRREWTVGLVAIVTAAAWIGRPLLARLFAGLSDAGIAIGGAVLLFVVPTSWRPFRRTLDWDDMERMPWGLLVLFGGGLSLAGAIQHTGLAGWLGEQLGRLGAVPILVLVAVVTTMIVFLTELASNTATTAAFLPVAAALAAAVGTEVVTFAVPVALAASCAFMMPVATPPNAIVYGSGQITMPQMARAGWWVNVLMVGLLTLAATILVPLVLG